MATIIDSPLSRSPRNKGNFRFTFKKRLTYTIRVLAVLSFVAVSWRVYSHGDYELFFQSSSSKPTNSYEYSMDRLNSAGVPSVSFSNTKRNFFDENNNNANNAVNTKAQAHVNDTKDFLDDEQMQPQQQKLPVYVQRHCDLRITVHDNATGENAEKLEEWWPADATDWRRRTPAALIIGAKKAGTTSLWLSLLRHATIHPTIQRARVKELLYFIPDRFKGWKNETRNTVLVHEARRNMYDINKDYPIQILERNQDAVSLEATPDYLLFSTYSARAILCTVPWVKLIVLLRHPIDRLWSHYNFLIDPNIIGLKNLLPFDEWVDKDIRRLQGYGILPQNLSNFEEHSGSMKEKRGWRVYQQKFHSRDDRPLARSLYAIQLEEWLLHLRQVGKDPADCVKIVLSSDLKQYQESVAKDILNWIGIPTVQQPHHGANNLDTPQQQQQQQALRQQRRIQGHPRTRHQTQQQQQPQPKGMVTTYTSPPMKEETRQKLELLFAPYNRRLYKLLGPEWDGIFDA